MILAIIQARMASTRLPGKALLPLLGEPMLARQIERVRRSKLIDKLVVATTGEPEDQAIADLCERLGVAYCLGPRDDVLRRFSEAHRIHGSGKADTIVRLTGDCPLSDPEVIDLVIGDHLRFGADLTVNTGQAGAGYPDGFDVEAFTGSALAEANTWTFGPQDREHVTRYMRRQPERYEITYCGHGPDLSARKWSVDTTEDYERVRAIFEALYPAKPEFGMEDILEWEAQRGR